MRAKLIALFIVAAIFPRSSAMAGGGPENVIVVVNARSWTSQTIANEYVQSRGIPSENVVYLDDVPDHEQIGVDLFRERILQPVLKTIDERGLAPQTDYVVYSSDLPWAIDLRPDLGRWEQKPPRVITPVAAINGLTYLYQPVMAGDPAYLQLNSNHYVRLPDRVAGAEPLTADDVAEYRKSLELIQAEQWAAAIDVLRPLAGQHPKQPQLHYNLACCLSRAGRVEEALESLAAAIDAGWSNRKHAEADADLEPLREKPEFAKILDKIQPTLVDTQPTIGFRAARKWAAGGQPTNADGRRYLLSTMLAVTSGRGTSVAEAVAALRRSAAADGNPPQGTIYYMKNGDVRSRTRDPLFPSAVAALQQLGVRAEVMDGTLPVNKPDVAGAMIGTAGFNWSGSGSRILPGAICEHLTSFGGVMREAAGQTPLSEFLRHGSAGSSGTVTEPFAIQAKFPLAFLHVHYARGSSLAEAFYQSVAGPYQLLIVGDPLCQPWAKIPQVAVDGLTAGQVVEDDVVLRPRLEGDEITAAHFEFFVDGRRTAVCGPGEALTLRVSELAGGFHEARIVAVSQGLIETQGRVIVPFFVERAGRKVALSVSENALPLTSDQPFEVTVRAPKAESITVVHNALVVGDIAAEQGTITIDPRQLGHGRVSLTAIAKFADEMVRSEPLDLQVNPPPPLPAQPISTDASPRRPGLLLTPADKAPQVVVATRDANWLAALKLTAETPFTLEGWFDAPADDVYQLQLNGNMAARVLIDGTLVAEGSAGGWTYAPVALLRGTHHLRVEATAAANPKLQIRFGAAGASSLDRTRFRHHDPPPAIAPQP